MSNDPQRGITKRHSNEWRSVRWWRRRQSNRLNLINYFKWLLLVNFAVTQKVTQFFLFAPVLSLQSTLFYSREKQLFRVSTKDNKIAFIGLFSNWRLPEFLYASIRAKQGGGFNNSQHFQRCNVLLIVLCSCGLLIAKKATKIKINSLP